MDGDGVVKSVRGFQWKLRDCDERIAQAISQKEGLPDVVGRLLQVRGVTAETANDFLHPTVRALMPDPSILIDMDIAAERLAKAVMSSEKVGVFGDYDVDGACASSVIKRFLEMLGIECEIYIPDRILEGYGPNLNALLGLQERGASLVITVDCGTVAFAPIEGATDAGLDVIVVDHHIGDVTKPKALAVVNPNQFNGTSELGMLCAAGVSFMLAVATTRLLRKNGWFETHSEPDLLKLLDMVALATVCDVVPLKGINRAFVSQGLKVIANRSNIGLAALADMANMRDKATVYHAGFVLGPRINAGGRVGEASLGAQLLTTNDVNDAIDIATRLERHNEERRAIEAIMLEQAISRVQNEMINDKVIFIGSESWHQGVVGIVAGRLKDIFDRPVAVMSFYSGLAKASCRSIAGASIGGAIAAAKDAGLLKNGGGHAMAAGFTAEIEKLPELKKFITERIENAVSDHSENRYLNFDSYITLSGINVSLVKQLEMAAPFGTGNSEPKFVIKGAKISYAEPVGNGHVKCFFTDDVLSTSKTKNRIKGMSFRASENGIFQAIMNHIGKNLDVFCSIHINSWNGNEIPELQIDDVMVSG